MQKGNYVTTQCFGFFFVSLMNSPPLWLLFLCHHYVPSESLQPGLLQWSCLKRIRSSNNVITSGSKIAKRLRRRRYDPVIIKKTIVPALGYSAVISIALWLTSRARYMMGLSKTPQRLQVPGLDPADCYSGLLKPLNLSSLTYLAEHSPLLWMSLVIIDIIHVPITTNICVLNFKDFSLQDDFWSLVYISGFLMNF